MKTLDRLLFTYTSFFVALLTIGAVINAAQNQSSLITLLFLLPVFGYLIFQLIIALYRFKYNLSHPSPALKKDPTPEATRVKLINIPQKTGFFHQTHVSFLITIALFTLFVTSTITLSFLNYL